MRRLIAATVLTALTACTDPQVDDTTPDTAAPPDDPILSACLTPEQRALVGQPDSVARATLPGDARLIPAGALFTQDYLPRRVNADLNANGVVTRVWCG